MGKSNIAAWSCYECMTSDLTKITMLSQNLSSSVQNERVSGLKINSLHQGPFECVGEERDWGFLIRKRCEWFDKWRVVSKSTQQIVDLERAFGRESEMQSELLGVACHIFLWRKGGDESLFKCAQRQSESRAAACSRLKNLFPNYDLFRCAAFSGLKKEDTKPFKSLYFIFPTLMRF